MLQCLCGKSLKKNKNPSGKLMIMCLYSAVWLPNRRCALPSVCETQVSPVLDLRFSFVCRNGDRSAIIFMQRVDHAVALGERESEGGGRGGTTTYSVQLLSARLGLGTRSAHEHAKSLPLHHHHGTMISQLFK